MSKRPIPLLHQKSKSRSPVEETVRRYWEDIVAGASNGYSRAEIREHLQKAKLHVGKVSGFNTAIRRVAEEKGISLDDLIRGSIGLSDLGSTADAEEVAAPINDEQPGADDGGHCPPTVEIGGEEPSAPVLSPFVDNRYKSTF